MSTFRRSLWHGIILMVATVICRAAAAEAMPTATARGDNARSIGVPHAPRIAPHLRGFGTTTVAGSGRHLSPPRSAILTISTLADSGPGSLRACIEYSAPRTCIFQVAGVITIRKALRIKSPYITIAGQTAPAPGITITGGGFSVETHDVFIQHLAIRPGDSPGGVPPRFRDGVSIGAAPPRSAFNVVLDHLSVSWAIDENISTWHRTTRDVTIANSIIAEGLYDSIHPKGPHSKGVMVGDGSRRVTLIGNLLAFNEERNPYIKPGTRTEVLNNVVYGWGGRGGWSLCNITNNEGNDAPVILSFIGNTYIPGPWSFVTQPIYGGTISPKSRIFARDNRFLNSDLSIASDWGATSLPQIPFRLRAAPFRSPGRSRMTSERAYQSVLKNAGSRPFNRSATDARIIKEVAERTGSLKDCITQCSRATGPLSEVNEISPPLRLPVTPFADRNRDGYTDLEKWLIELGTRRSTD